MNKYFGLIGQFRERVENRTREFYDRNPWISLFLIIIH